LSRSGSGDEAPKVRGSGANPGVYRRKCPVVGSPQLCRGERNTLVDGGFKRFSPGDHGFGVRVAGHDSRALGVAGDVACIQVEFGPGPASDIGRAARLGLAHHVHSTPIQERPPPWIRTSVLSSSNSREIRTRDQTCVSTRRMRARQMQTGTVNTTNTRRRDLKTNGCESSLLLPPMLPLHDALRTAAP
jgi:hypothetical protein